MADGTLFKDMGLGIKDEFKDLIEDFKKAFEVNDEKAREMVGKLFYDQNMYPGTMRKKGGLPSDELEDEKKEKAARTNPLGYAINTMGTNKSIEALRSAASNTQSVEDVKTHKLLNEQLKAIKVMSPRAA